MQGPYLSLAKPIDVDREANIWPVSVVVSDRGDPRLSAIVDIVIYVEGVDDNPPVWAAPENGKYVVGRSDVGSLKINRWGRMILCLYSNTITVYMYLYYTLSEFQSLK